MAAARPGGRCQPETEAAQALSTVTVPLRLFMIIK